MLILMNTPEDMSRLTPSLPAAAAKRKRANIKPGTCIRLQPLKPGASKAPAWLHFICASKFNFCLGTNHRSRC